MPQDPDRVAPSPNLDARLLTAVNMNRIDEARDLLGSGVSPNGAGAHPNGTQRITPLSQALLLNNEGMVRLLLEHGADVNAPGGPGNAPVLVYAMRTSKRPLVQLLLDHGARPDVSDEVGLSLMVLATTRPRKPEGAVRQVVEAYLKQGLELPANEWLGLVRDEIVRGQIKSLEQLARLPLPTLAPESFERLERAMIECRPPMQARVKALLLPLYVLSEQKVLRDEMDRAIDTAPTSVPSSDRRRL